MPNDCLTLEEILSINDDQHVPVEVPEWGGTVYIRTITADERDKFEIALGEMGKVGIRAALVGACLCDANGKPSNPSEAQIRGLGKKASGPLDRVFSAALTLNRINETDVEVLEKNSEGADAPAPG